MYYYKEQFNLLTIASTKNPTSSSSSITNDKNGNSSFSSSTNQPASMINNLSIHNGGGKIAEFKTMLGDRVISKRIAYIGSEICELASTINRISLVNEDFYPELFNDSNKVEFNLILELWDNLSKNIKTNTPLQHVNRTDLISKINGASRTSM